MTEAGRELRDPKSLIVGAIAAQVMGGLVTQLSPLLVAGTMTGLSLSERGAGFVAAVELISLAASVVAIAPVLPRFRYRQVALLAVALTLLGQGASILSASWLSFAMFRGVSGVGEGALYAVSLCIVGSHCANPDRVYGYFQIVWALGSVALFSVGGELATAFAHRGVVALIAGVTLLLTPLLLLLPNARARSANSASANAALPSSRLGVMTLSAVGLYLTVSAAVYVFSAPLGERAGLDTRAVGYALTVASLVGLVGAAAATAINVRWGRALPISFFCAAFSLVVLVLCLSRDHTAYVVALVASCVIYYFSLPYLFGLAAALDRSGRWAAAAGSAYLLGFAAGPLVGGSVIGESGYAGLAAVCVATTLVAWALALAVNRALSRRLPSMAT